MVKVTTFRYDSNRSVDTAAFDGFIGDIGKTSRRKIHQAYENVLIAATLAGEVAAEAGRDYIEKGVRRVDTADMWGDFDSTVKSRGSNKGSVSIGWVHGVKDYYDWQERGTYGKRNAARSGRFYHTGKIKAKGPKQGRAGITPMYAIPLAKEVFHQEFNKNLRSLGD